MTTATAPTAIRYPHAAREFARRMGEANFCPTEIQAALAKRGIRPTLTTVTRWADPDYRDAENERMRRGRQIRRMSTPRLRLNRMQELRDVGLSFDAIRRVVNHDLGLELTTEQVRGILNGATKNVRELLGG